MFNPAMFGVDPEQLRQAQQVGEHVEARVLLERRRGRFTVTFHPRTDALDLGHLAGRTVEALTSQLYQFFGIRSEVEDVE
jgi:hypothetical protein